MVLRSGKLRDHGNNMKYAHYSLAICLLLTLAACGFTLRGSADLPPQLQTLLLESNNGNSDIIREMRRALGASGVSVLDTPPDEGVYRLGLGQEQVQERVLSVNSNARAGEYELSMSVAFQLRNNSEFIIPQETLVIDRVYLADPENAVAKSEEAELIRTEMRRELVNQVLRRLQTVNLQPAP